MTRLNEARERQAGRELGRTAVGRGAALLLTGAFLLTVLSVPALQLAGTPPAWASLLEGVPSECELERFERDLDDESVVGGWLLPRLQALLLERLGLGNEQVYPGREGWLFGRPGVDYASGQGFLEPEVLARRVRDADPCTPAPQPDPRLAIADFDAQLRARGVRLLVVPTPVKAVVAPGRLARGTVRAPAHNPSFAELVAFLEAEDVAVFDPTAALLDPSAYLATDTHWRPEPMTRVAQILARHVEALAPLSPPRPGAWTREVAVASNRGDLLAMLRLPDGQELYPAERVRIHPLVASDPAPPAPGAEVLLLGDSFSNIYSDPRAFARGGPGAVLGWGADAGFAEQLALALGRPVDRIVRNNGGAVATRVGLARQLEGARAQGRDALEGVRVVVWQFAVSALMNGDWRLVTLPEPPTAGTVATPRESASGDLVLEGTVAAHGVLPRPGSVPYPDALLAVHLVDVDGLGDASAAVVYVYGMRDHVWTDAARWEPGLRVRLRAAPWERDDVQQLYATQNRAELDDLALLALPTYWAEPEAGEGE